MKGDIITADAMSCQKKIVEKIIEKKADYTIGLKQNQPALYKDIEDYFNEFSADIPSKTTLDKGHGRIEKREYRLLTNLSWLGQKNEWKGLNALGCARSTITENGEVREFTRYFITSLTDLDEFADSVRKHWSIENCTSVPETASVADLSYELRTIHLANTVHCHYSFVFRK